MILAIIQKLNISEMYFLPPVQDDYLILHITVFVYLPAYAIFVCFGCLLDFSICFSRLSVCQPLITTSPLSAVLCTNKSILVLILHQQHLFKHSMHICILRRVTKRKEINCVRTRFEVLQCQTDKWAKLLACVYQCAR